MPTPELDIIIAPQVTTFSVALEPAHNALHSLFLLIKADHMSGLNEWVDRIRASLTPELERRNRLVILGLYHALVPQRSYSSFAAYLDNLDRLEPAALRDRVLDDYFKIPPKDPGSHTPEVQTDILSSEDTFIRFLIDRFPTENIDLEIETEAFVYLNDPPAMKNLILTHLREMWDTYLESEWKRVVPMLQESVAAFQQVDFRNLDNLEAIQLVTGQSMEDCKDAWFEKAERIIFVPSAHVGPYIFRYKAERTLWLLFGARLPEGAQVVSPDLSRAEILVRLSAMADDTRLRILKLIAEGSEFSSKDIMLQLELSQSAASRHLTQLTATGYLEERRCEGAKCYSLNPERVENTLRAVATYLEINN